MSPPVRKSLISAKIARRYSLGADLSISAVKPSFPGNLPPVMRLRRRMNCPHESAPASSVWLLSSIWASSSNTPASNGHDGRGRRT
eukprot:2437087-Rhodomonas_salina.1